MQPYKYIALAFLVLLVGACSLQKDIEVELPPYKTEMVVECYLQSLQPHRLSLIESSPFLAPPEPKVVESAKAVVYLNGNPDTLFFNPELDRRLRKVYTHTSNKHIRARTGDVYTLLVWDKSGRKITGSATVLPRVRMDTIEYIYNDRGQAYILAKFKDNGDQQNFYRFTVHKDSINHSPEVDYASPDNLNNGKDFAFGTGYDFKKGDRVFVTLYHLEKKYYDFITSLENAKDANGNPFAQPSGIKSTVQGGIGVFTYLVFDRRLLILK